MSGSGRAVVAVIVRIVTVTGDDDLGLDLGLETERGWFFAAC